MLLSPSKIKKVSRKHSFKDLRNVSEHLELSARWQKEGYLLD